MKNLVFFILVFSNFCFGQEWTAKDQANTVILEVNSLSKTNVEDLNNIKNELNAGLSEMKIYQAEVQFIYFQSADIVFPTLMNGDELFKK